MRILVCRAQAGVVRQVWLELLPGTTAGEAAQASGLAGSDWCGAIGVHGAQVAPEHRLVEGDRVELYQPLAVEPRARRRNRAERRR